MSGLSKYATGPRTNLPAVKLSAQIAKQFCRCPGENSPVKPLDVQPPAKSSPDHFGALDSSNSPQSSHRQPSIPNRSPFKQSNPYTNQRPQPPRTQNTGIAPRRHLNAEPHRGGLVLGLGIAAIVCNFLLIPGILALILGMNDLRAMKEGRMDNEGHSMTLAGTIMGGIITALAMLSLILVAFYILFIFTILANA